MPGEKLGEKLERFLETLPSEEGFVFGVPERLAVEELLLALVRRGEFPEDPRELKPLLAPLFCGNRAQQERFHAEFDGEFAPVVTVVAAPVEPPPRPVWWPFWAALAAIAVMVAAGWIARLYSLPIPALPMPAPPALPALPTATSPPAPTTQLVGRVLSESGRPLRGAFGRKNLKPEENAGELAVVVTKAYDLTLWILRKVEKSSKAYRFSLGQRMIDSSLDLTLALVDAAYRKDKKSPLRAASSSTNSLRYLLRFSKDVGMITLDS